MDELFTHEREGEEGMWPASLHLQPLKQTSDPCVWRLLGFFPALRLKETFSFWRWVERRERIFLYVVGETEGLAEGTSVAKGDRPISYNPLSMHVQKRAYEDRGGLSKHRLLASSRQEWVLTPHDLLTLYLTPLFKGAWCCECVQKGLQTPKGFFCFSSNSQMRLSGALVSLQARH